jgi:hypothetical protein
MSHEPDAGTPEAALFGQLQQQRAGHLAALEEIRADADELISLARNASAAATVALEGPTPADDPAGATGTELAARDEVDAAKDQLTALTNTWAELDPAARVAAERLRAAAAPPVPPAPPPRPGMPLPTPVAPAPDAPAPGAAGDDTTSEPPPEEPPG